ncbi:hypothetical protein C8J57DRAFT_1527029 [Mycena rebaudengoi]|nr:hypothetical protein C8J57DRAFT_1527029 [Mycena rebaudengoi]
MTSPPASLVVPLQWGKLSIHRFTHSPLPVELLSRVLQLCLPIFHLDSWLYDCVLLQLRRVCRSWTAILDTTPDVWSHIYMTNTFAVRHLERSLARSGSLPISLHLELDDIRNVVPPLRIRRAELEAFVANFVTAMSAYAPRWVGAVLVSPTHSVSTLLCNQLASIPLSSLRRMDVRLACTSEPTRSPLPLLFAPGFQSLRWLRIRSCAPHCGPLQSCPAIQDFGLADIPRSFEFSWTMFRNHLLSMQGLTHLTLANVEIVELPQNTGYMSLPLLTHLHLELETLLSFSVLPLIRFPSIKTVHLGLYGPLAAPRFHQFCGSLMDYVHQAVLSFDLSDRDFRALLGTMPMLEELDISRCRSLHVTLLSVLRSDIRLGSRLKVVKLPFDAIEADIYALLFKPGDGQLYTGILDKCGLT